VVELKIGQVLTRTLKEKRLTVRQLAKATGIAHSTLNEWASNRTPRDPIQAHKVASYLGVTLHYFLFGKEDENESINLTRILKEDLFTGTFEITLRKVKIERE
jgi:transcriptional regulator with XRE-family HTH domain